MEFLNTEKKLAQATKSDAGASEDKEEWLYQSGKLALIEDLEMKIQQLIIQNNNERII